MPRCAAKSCYNSSETKPSLAFFKFPKELETFKVWANNSGRQDLLEKACGKSMKCSAVLCAEHFELNCFLNPRYKTQLKRSDSPSPTIFVNNLKDCYITNCKKYDGATGTNTDSFATTEYIAQMRNSDAVKRPESPTASCLKNLKHLCLSPDKQMCRLCAGALDNSSTRRQMTLIDELIRDMMNMVLQNKVELDDDMPQRICICCYGVLKDCVSMVNSFNEADRILRLNTEGCLLNRQLEVNQIKPNINCDSNLSIDDTSAITLKEGKCHDYCVYSHICAVCGEPFKLLPELKKHEKLNHASSKSSSNDMEKDREYKCLMCSFLFENVTLLRVHKRLHHYPKQNECSYCGKRYLTKHMVDKHKLKSHLLVKRYSCAVCGEGFNSQRRLGKHEFTHKQEEEALFCAYCAKRCASLRQLSSHEARHSNNRDTNGNGKRFLCNECGKILCNRESLKNHLKRHALPNSYACDACKKTFKSHAKWQMHQATHSADTNYQCPLCEKCFHLKSLVRQHLLSHSTEKPFECFCGSRFNRKGNLSQHRKKHSPEEISQPGDRVVYECGICLKRMKSQTTLKYHLGRHSGNKKPLDCELCGKCFSSITSYTVHMRSHTGERPFLCCLCGKAFRRSMTLKQHTRSVHSDARPYSCQHCSKAFKRLYSLVVHRKTHTGEKPHICDICLRGFTQHGDLLRHKKTHNRMENVDLPAVSLDSQPVSFPAADPDDVIMGINTMTELALGDFLIGMPCAVVDGDNCIT